MKKIWILTVTLLVVLVMLIGVGAGACRDGVEEVEEENGEEEKAVEEVEVASKPHFTSDDGRIEFALDNVERTKVGLIKIGTETYVVTPEEGYENVFIDVTVVRIKDGHFDTGRSWSRLVDSSGVEHEPIRSSWKGLKWNGSPGDPGFETEMVEGAQGTLVFITVPEKVALVKLRLGYIFFESWSESGQRESEEERYIDIILP